MWESSGYFNILTKQFSSSNKNDYKNPVENSVNPNPHEGVGRGGADSARPQIIFFINSARATKFGEFSQNLMENKILYIKLTDFYPESSDMSIFGESPCQKVVKLQVLVRKSIKIVFSDSSCNELSKI